MSSTSNKRARDNNTDKIRVDLKSSWDGRTLSFNIGPCTPMSNLIKAYLSRRQLGDHYVVFIYKGNRLQKKSTAEQLGMKDGDDVLVACESLGGSSKISN